MREFLSRVKDSDPCRVSGSVQPNATPDPARMFVSGTSSPPARAGQMSLIVMRQQQSLEGFAQWPSSSLS
jgi:hypothetical protein